MVTAQLALGVALLLQGAPAGAPPPPALPEAVQELLDDAEYAKARRSIDRALRAPSLPADQRVALYAAHALCDISLGDETAAAQAYQKLLTLRPDHRVDPARTSPKVLEVFQLVRARMAEEGALDSAYQPEFQPLPDVTAGEDLPVAVSFKGVPAASIQRLFVRYRRVGDASFESAELPRGTGGGAFSGAIPRTFLREDEDDYAVDYYLDALDGQGERLTGVGTAALPLQFKVTRPETVDARGQQARADNMEQVKKVLAIAVPIVVGVVAVAGVGCVGTSVLGLTALDPGATHLWLRRFQQ
jgi:tetratricopeptide (TPR) repeat protein